MTLQPRAVVIRRPTEYDLLLDRHGTHRQVTFFLGQRDRDTDEVLTRHREQQDALQSIAAAIPVDWRRAQVTRSDLDRWLFAPEDLVIAVGQDGLVANVGKYLAGQPILGVNPSGSANAGVLVPHDPAAAAARLRTFAGLEVDGIAEQPMSERAMVRVVTDSGQQLTAVNEIFIGQRSHQSARYALTVFEGDGGNGGGGRDRGGTEFQSSSGILISTGTGSTGWSRSLWNARRCDWPLPGPESTELAWFVREAWPSRSTGTSLIEGVLAGGRGGGSLRVVAMSDSLVAFGDGIEQDRIELSWGQEATVDLADERLRLLA